MEKKFDKELFENAPVPVAVRKFVMPAMASAFITILYSLGDTLFVGMLGDPHQTAALSIVFPFYQTINAFGSLWGIGANSRMSNSLGEKNYDNASQSSNIGFWCGGCFMAFWIILYAIFQRPLLTFCGAGPDTFGYASGYMLWVYIIGGIPSVLSIVMSNLLRSEGHAKKASRGLMMGGLLNFILDPVFIFGFHTGIVGAAIATMLSNLVSLIFFLIVYFRIRKTSYIQLKPFACRWTGEAVRRIVLVGMPFCCLNIFAIIGCMCEMKITASYNDESCAAWGVVLKMNFIGNYTTWGVSQGVLPLIGYNYGARNDKRVREVNKLAFKVLLCFMCVLVVLCEIFAPNIMRFFLHNDLAASIGTRLLRLYIVVAPLMSVIQLVSAMCQAIGRWSDSLIMIAIRQLVLHVPLLFLMNMWIGLDGVSLSMVVSDIIILFVAIYVYRRNFIKGLVH